ncbi:hypothetical protein [Mucilaginibacter sp.]|nr:hypothetical protein [Mucilaginibacter sp.]
MNTELRAKSFIQMVIILPVADGLNKKRRDVNPKRFSISSLIPD